MVRPRTWLLPSRFDTRPGFAIQVEIEQIVEVSASFALIPSKEVETVHEGDASGPRPLVGLLTKRFDLVPAVLAHAVLKEVVQSFVIVGACEQVNVSVGENALVSCSRSEDLALCEHLHPFVHLHLLEVLLRVLGSHILLFLELACEQLNYTVFLEAALLLMIKLHGLCDMILAVPSCTSVGVSAAFDDHMIGFYVLLRWDLGSIRLDLGSIKIVALHSIEAAEDEKPLVI